jgi:hypothetical protein
LRRSEKIPIRARDAAIADEVAKTEAILKKINPKILRNFIEIFGFSLNPSFHTSQRQEDAEER